MDTAVSLDRLAPELSAEISKLGETAVTRADDIARRTADEMRDYASGIAPKGRGAGKGGHHLNQSLTMTESKYGSGMNAKFYVSATKWRKYGIVHLLELGHLKPFGNGYVSPHPFMKRSLSQFSAVFNQRISDMLDQLKGV
jgi:hypothetical protein